MKEKLRTANELSTFSAHDLAKVFPQKEAEGSYNFGIIAIHGNEPQLIVAGIAMEINAILKQHGLKPPVLVLPKVYDDTPRILREEFSDNTGEIFISDELGTILKKTEFSEAGYQDHLQQVADHQEDVRRELGEFLSRPYFKATSLDGETREFYQGGRRLELNAGANVSASEVMGRTHTTHFYFPVLLSRLVEAIKQDRDIVGTYDPEALEKVHRMAVELEATYNTTQIGYIHTLSYLGSDYDATGQIFTPAPKKKKLIKALIDGEGNKVEINNGIYIMASGSGIGVEVLMRQVGRLAEQGYQIIAPPWMKNDLKKREIKAIITLPDAIFHDRVKAVIGRAGWGILWNAQAAGKPFADIASGEYDNPEIKYNRRSIEAANMGKPFSLKKGFIEELVELSPDIARLNQDIARDLNVVPDVDGLRYSAINILNSEIKKAKKRVK